MDGGLHAYADRGSSAEVRRRGYLVWLAVVAAGVGGGLLAGARLAHPGVRILRAPATVAPTTTAVDLPDLSAADAGPRRVASGIPVGYAHSQEGAASAAVNYLHALAGPQLLDPAAYDAILQRITTRSGFSRLRKQANAGRPQAIANLGVGRAPAPQLVIRSASLGYHLDAYTQARATVSVWSVGVVGSSTTRPPDATWSTTTVELAWQSGGWRMDRYRTVPGPVPPESASQPDSAPAEIFDASGEFRDFGYVHP